MGLGESCRVANEDIDAAEPIQNRIDQALYVALLGDVGPDREGVLTQCLNDLYYVFGPTALMR